MLNMPGKVSLSIKSIVLWGSVIFIRHQYLNPFFSFSIKETFIVYFFEGDTRVDI